MRRWFKARFMVSGMASVTCARWTAAIVVSARDGKAALVLMIPMAETMTSTAPLTGFLPDHEGCFSPAC